MIGVGLSLPATLRRAILSKGTLAPPAGFIFLVDADGFYLVDADGSYLVEAI